MNRKVSCPTCKKPVEWSEASKYRPFCSARCRMIDLGEWASGSYSVPVEEQDQFIDLEKSGSDDYI